MNRRHLFVPLVLATTLASSDALAIVRREGTWPSGDRRVSLSIEKLPRNAALQKVAEASGLSIVAEAGDAPVSLHVRDQAPGDVLEAILSGGDFVLARKGTLVTVRADAPSTTTPSAESSATAPSAAAPSAPGAASVAPVDPGVRDVSSATPDVGGAPVTAATPTTRGDDRVVTGGSLELSPGEVVHDLTVLGGDAKVRGTVTGDVAVFGGKVLVAEGAHVLGSVTAVGGRIDVERGAVVDGKASVVGGVLFRAPGSHIDGAVTSTGGSVAGITRDVDGLRRAPGVLADPVRALSRAIVHGSLLFVLGAVLLALAERRSTQVLGEIAARPMRSFAVGVVGALAVLVATTLLAVTIIGIPFAVIGLIAGAGAVFAGIAAVSTTVGKALFGHKLTSPYTQLAAGLALFVVITHIPFVGGFVGFAAAMIGVGALVATRASRARRGDGPYRTAAST